MSNMQIWDALGKTDPAHTKDFSRAGGFKGTALRPMWAIKRLTEQFGPYGVGWGSGEPRFDLVHGQEGEVMVYCTVSVWHTDRANIGYGVGGDKAIARNKNGLFHDDEAFKKAHTDAVMNGFKMIGVGADIHMGMYEDSKYVAQIEREFAAPVETISDEQQTLITNLASQAGITIGGILKRAGVSSLTDFPAADFDKLHAALNSKIKDKAKETA